MLESLGTNLPDDSNLDAAIEDRKEEIARLRRELRTLEKHRQNYRAPVSRLPNEILCDIFIYYIGDSFTRRWILNLTRVCRRWRRVAIGFSRLWNYIDISGTYEAVETFVLRSGTSLLTVLWTEPHDQSRSCQHDPSHTCSAFAFEFFSSHSHRIHVMHIDLPARCAHKLLYSLSIRSISFPLITHLDGHLREIGYGPDSLSYDPQLLLPPHFLPQLTFARCVGATVDLLYGLHTSPLTDVILGESCWATTFEVWVEVIAKLRTLRVLDFRAFLESEVDNGVKQTPFEFPPCLEHLIVVPTYYAFEAIQFLNHLQIAAQTTVTVDLSRAAEGIVPEDIDLLADVAARGQASASTRQSILSCRASDSEITLWDHIIPARDLASYTQTGKMPLWILPLHNDATCAGDTHASLLSMFPLPELSVLVLSGDGVYNNRANFPWQRLTTLREISIEGFQGFMGLLEALERSLRLGEARSGSEDNSDSASPAAFLPNLQVLELLSVPFRSHKSARKRRGKPSPADRLEEALRIRKQHELLLEKLYVIEPMFLDDYDYDPCVRMEGLAVEIVHEGYGDERQHHYYCSSCESGTEEEEEEDETEERKRGEEEEKQKMLVVV